MQTLTRPYFERRTYHKVPMYFVRTVCGLLVSRPTAGEALHVFGDQEALWKATEEVRPNANPGDPIKNETPELVITARGSKE